MLRKFSHSQPNFTPISNYFVTYALDTKTGERLCMDLEEVSLLALRQKTLVKIYTHEEHYP